MQQKFQKIAQSGQLMKKYTKVLSTKSFETGHIERKNLNSVVGRRKPMDKVSIMEKNGDIIKQHKRELP